MCGPGRRDRRPAWAEIAWLQADSYIVCRTRALQLRRPGHREPQQSQPDLTALARTKSTVRVPRCAWQPQATTSAAVSGLISPQRLVLGRTALPSSREVRKTRLAKAIPINK